MEAIARALVYAAVYIDCRAEDGDEMYLDQDVKALESIASILRHATAEEEDQLAAAAEFALAERTGVLTPPTGFRPRLFALDGGDARRRLGRQSACRRRTRPERLSRLPVGVSLTRRAV